MWDRKINGGTNFGGTAKASSTQVLGEDSFRVLVDISNRHATKWLFVSIGTDAEVDKGFAIAPESSTRIPNASGSVHIICADGDVPYSGFSAR